MGTYSKAELLNEVSQIFRAGLTPGKDGGTLNTAEEYLQLLEMVSTTFLFNQDSVFYVARIAANRLNTTVRQEVAILEDLLVSLEDLGKIGQPVRDSATLSNARTTVLTLDAAESVSGRPETTRFTRQMDKFAASVKKNVVSVERGNIMVRPREDARNVIQKNLERLSPLHDRLLEEVFAVRDVLEQYLELDIPSRVSSNVLSAINTRLLEATSTVEDTTDTQNLEANRDLFLQSLANKVSVKLLGTFKDPTDLKYRSLPRPIPSTVKHLGRVTGTGEAGHVLTSAGPWSLPVSGDLELRTQAGSLLSVPLTEIKGAALNGRNREPFYIDSEAKNLHVVVDPDSYEGTVQSAPSTTELVLNEVFDLSFKHLGCPVSFPFQNPVTLSDIYDRTILDLSQLQYFTPGNFVQSGKYITATSPIGVNEAAIGFQPGHVGCYLKTAGAGYVRMEIIEVVGPELCIVDDRGGLTFNLGINLDLRGQPSSGAADTRIHVQSAFTTSPSPGDSAVIGPAIKSVMFTTGGPFTVTDLLADVDAENIDIAGLQTVGAILDRHVAVTGAAGDSARLALRNRSRKNPYLQITGRMTRVDTTPGPPDILQASAHRVLGFFEGEEESEDKLSPSELVNALSGYSGITSEIVTTILATGKGMTCYYGTSDVEDLAGDFSSVEVGDQIAISHPVVGGTYQVSAVVSDTKLTLDAPLCSSSERDLEYQVFREQVKIATSSSSPGSYLEVVSAPTELGLTVGKVYSTIPQFTALDKLGKTLTFDGVISGDLLKVVGDPVEHEIVDLQDGDTVLVLEEGLPSNLSDIGFEIRSLSAKLFDALHARLQTYTSSPNLLRKNKFNESVEAIDNAVTAAILPGRNFLAARNQARRMVADLISILSTNLRREDEYDADIPSSADTLAAILENYNPVPRVRAVDDLVDTFLERKYDRSAALLQQGRMIELYETTDESGSYGGKVLADSRKVIRDLPQPSRTSDDLLNQRDIAVGTLTSYDPDEDFTDYEESPEEPFE